MRIRIMKLYDLSPMFTPLTLAAFFEIEEKDAIAIIHKQKIFVMA